jgi:hypothetical protein
MKSRALHGHLLSLPPRTISCGSIANHDQMEVRTVENIRSIFLLVSRTVMSGNKCLQLRQIVTAMYHLLSIDCQALEWKLKIKKPARVVSGGLSYCVLSPFFVFN